MKGKWGNKRYDSQNNLFSNDSVKCGEFIYCGEFICGEFFKVGWIYQVLWIKLKFTKVPLLEITLHYHISMHYICDELIGLCLEYVIFTSISRDISLKPTHHTKIGVLNRNVTKTLNKKCCRCSVTKIFSIYFMHLKN